MRIREHKKFSGEMRRLGALHDYAILNSPEEQPYDDIARMAALACDTPIALISLTDLDRQWFKSRIGTPLTEAPREDSFCAAAVASSRSTDVLVVNDAATDPRFARNPWVTTRKPIRFYAGAPLRAPSGHALGTLCVLDWKPRHLTPHQIQTLLFLAARVMAKLETRRFALGDI